MPAAKWEADWLVMDVRSAKITGVGPSWARGRGPCSARGRRASRAPGRRHGGERMSSSATALVEHVRTAAHPEGVEYLAADHVVDSTTPPPGSHHRVVCESRRSVDGQVVGRPT